MSGDDAVSGSAERWNYEDRRRTLRKKRKELKMSQTDLARLAGFDRYTVSRFESGAADIKGRTLARLEEVITDMMAGRKLADVMRMQRMQLGTLSEMSPPKPGTEAYWQRREEFVRQGKESMTQLALDNTQLVEINGKLTQQIGVLEGMIKKLEDQNHVLHEISTLQGEAIRLFEEEEAKKPKEVAPLLQRAATLAKK